MARSSRSVTSSTRSWTFGCRTWAARHPRTAFRPGFGGETRHRLIMTWTDVRPGTVDCEPQPDSRTSPSAPPRRPPAPPGPPRWYDPAPTVPRWMARRVAFAAAGTVIATASVSWAAGLGSVPTDAVSSSQPIAAPLNAPVGTPTPKATPTRSGTPTPQPSPSQAESSPAPAESPTPQASVTVSKSQAEPSGTASPSEAPTAEQGGSYPHLKGDLDARPELLGRLERLASSRGETWTVTSGLRSIAEQQRLWDNRHNNPYPVEPPGMSRHHDGEAADVTIDGRAIQDVVPRDELVRAGLSPLAGDAVHVELP
jgi:D-alanyl-D-alanine carboxypeptidase